MGAFWTKMKKENSDEISGSDYRVRKAGRRELFMFC